MLSSVPRTEKGKGGGGSGEGQSSRKERLYLKDHPSVHVNPGKKMANETKGILGRQKKGRPTRVDGASRFEPTSDEKRKWSAFHAGGREHAQGRKILYQRRLSQTRPRAAGRLRSSRVKPGGGDHIPAKGKKMKQDKRWWAFLGSAARPGEKKGKTLLRVRPTANTSGTTTQA